MCKGDKKRAILSSLATWAFFVLLLNLLNVQNPGIYGLFLTVLIFVAAITCPICNPEGCSVKPKKKKKK